MKGEKFEERKILADHNGLYRAVAFAFLEAICSEPFPHSGIRELMQELASKKVPLGSLQFQDQNLCWTGYYDILADKKKHLLLLDFLLYIFGKVFLSFSSKKIKTFFKLFQQENKDIF